ncbi:MAG: hypothetical protein OEM91_05430 [Hyphomicrobiales bacterium]|nr:hypothetical protein [Hyphomicrobiales bacterium]
MKKTLLALSVAAFAMGSVAPAFAADEMKPCNPPKDGWHMDKDGKCVKTKK